MFWDERNQAASCNTPSTNRRLRTCLASLTRRQLLKQFTFLDHLPAEVQLIAELRPYLKKAFELVKSDQTHVVGRDYLTKAGGFSGWRNCNLRTTFEKLVRRAGLRPWPRLFHNLRSSRETELLEKFPVHVVALWMAHDAKVSLKHYAQTTEEYFNWAVSGAKSGAAGRRRQWQQIS